MDNIGDILEWLLMELLLRLPPASVRRFKVVCKQWLSMILSPYFLQTYAFPEAISSCWAFVSPMLYDCSKSHGVGEHELLMDLHSGDLKCPIPNQSTNDDLYMSGYTIMGVSNGLVLYHPYVKNLRDDEHHEYWGVCNPVTKEYFVLPPCITGFHRVDSWGFLSQMKDGAVTSYTIVVYSVKMSRFEVFFSETGEWKAYTVSLNQVIDRAYLHLASTDLDGVLHWIHPLTGIIAYDPHRNPDMLRVISFPTDRDRRMLNKGRMGMCGTHQGHLRYFESAALSLSVWVLNDYGCGDNWLLQHRASYVDIMQDVRHDNKRLKHKIKLQPISFHPFDPDVIYMGCDYIFISYDMRERKTKVLKTFGAKKERRRHYQWRRAFPLVIPPFSSSLPAPSLREQI